MYCVTWERYPHGIEGEATDTKWRWFDNLEKAKTFLLNRYHLIRGVNWAGGRVEDESTGKYVYEITSDCEIFEE